MAKTNRPTDTATADNDLDLVGGSAENTGNGAAATTADGTNNTVDGPPSVAEVAQKSEEELKKEEADKKIAELQQQIKDLRAQKKGEKAKKEKVLKGQNVTFVNKANERITGLGVVYYVVRSGGKLHYKEASQVQVLPADWKDGDPIPEVAAAAPAAQA